MDPLDSQETDELKWVAAELRRLKPKGWSVVYGRNEIIVRPADRAGKFRITYQDEYGWYVMFFCRLLNYWNKSAKFSPGATIATELQTWMNVEALEPTKETRDE